MTPSAARNGDPGDRPERRTLRLVGGPDRVQAGESVVVLDTAWTPGRHVDPPGPTSIREVVDAVLGEVDPIAATRASLDAWAAAAGVIETLTIGSTSFWYYVRIRHSLWLQERLLWAHVLRRLLDRHRPTTLVVPGDADPALLDVARLIVDVDGVELEIDGMAPVMAGRDRAPATGAADADADADGAATRAVRSVARRLRRRFRRLLGRPAPVGRSAPPSLQPILRRLDVLAAEGPRLLVVLEHAPQVVALPSGARTMNPFLGPIADQLRGTHLEPVFVDWRARLGDPASMARVAGADAERTLPRDACLVDDEPLDPAVLPRAARLAASIRGATAPLDVCGIDLGPLLAGEVATTAERWFPAMHRTVARIGRLLARLQPSGILLADEYHRQDWLEAARQAGIPVAAVQHGIISADHEGYVHPTRPGSLRLPDRTYVFGRWERDLLIRRSVYREAEVVVGGSPRLDIHASTGAGDRSAIRAQVGAEPRDRLVVLSGSWGEVFRRFFYPVVLARLFDRPLPHVRLVVKLHPGEQDEGPYRSVVEGVAAAGGFAAPPITVVRDVDLYGLLAAADAHLGIHSTVLTEAVVVGTPNLLAACIEGGDMLDYVAGGVAAPIDDGGDLLAALDAPATSPARRTAFLAAHYEPGNASDRIAADLLAWLP